MKKAWKIISTVCVWVIVAITVAIMIFTMISVNTFGRNDRDIFGYKFYIVLTDSMSATDFNAGDLVIVKEVDPTTLKVGDIISFTSQDPENYGAVITHKIHSLTTDASGERGFITYGTTTGTLDETVVTYPFIQGKYQFALPQVGTFFHFLKTPQGYIICILVPFLLLILYQGLNCVKIFRQYKAEQMAELQAEKDAIEAERRKSDAMMAELMAMKAQLANAAVATTPPPTAPAQPVAETIPAAPAQPVAETAPAAPAQPVAETAPATPAQPENPAPAPQQVDVAAMMAELEALKAQLANANAANAQPAPQSQPEKTPAENSNET